MSTSMTSSLVLARLQFGYADVARRGFRASPPFLPPDSKQTTLLAQFNVETKIHNLNTFVF
ncbi:hypothetical protein Sjap_008506 [Stephania japonica]|uniref:Uncharacterized protein n=1 Tax=Stephania japonica TaxID=461633 RepID=A0AAP0JS11_9MAGN